MGVSMGGAVAIMAAPDLPVAAVVADAAYADLRNPIANRMREAGYPLAALGSRLVVGGGQPAGAGPAAVADPARGQIAPRGLLLIAPPEDRMVSPEQSRRMFEAAGEPKELFMVEGAAHADAHAAAPRHTSARVLAARRAVGAAGRRGRIR